MSETIDLVRALESELTERIVPVSAHDLSERLNPLTLQLSQQGPVLSKDTRMFRIRPMDYKPGLIDEVGAPSQGKIRIGRLNDQDHRVLYLADSPDTAFAERRVNPGELCLLSEWRVNVEQLVMANGGIPQANFAQYFPSDVSQNVLPIFTPREYTQEILDLFRQIYTMDVGQNTSLYRWSIACGLVNGFSSQCDRKNVEETIDGMTKWSGRYPFAAIAYPSTRIGNSSLNYAFNDRGMSHIRLDNVQWVRREKSGYISLDFANRLDSAKAISWQNRPANIQLKSGERGKVTKIAETVWKYETENGSIPWFS